MKLKKKTKLSLLNLFWCPFLLFSLPFFILPSPEFWELLSFSGEVSWLRLALLVLLVLAWRDPPLGLILCGLWQVLGFSLLLFSVGEFQALPELWQMLVLAGLVPWAVLFYAYAWWTGWEWWWHFF